MQAETYEESSENDANGSENSAKEKGIEKSYPKIEDV